MGAEGKLGKRKVHSCHNFRVFMVGKRYFPFVFTSIVERKVDSCHNFRVFVVGKRDLHSCHNFKDFVIGKRYFPLVFTSILGSRAPEVCKLQAIVLPEPFCIVKYNKTAPVP